MDEQMIEQIAKAIELPFLPHGYELKPHLLKVAARAAHSVMSARVAEQWQPIETAPKDGTPVIIGWHVYMEVRGISRARWVSAEFWADLEGGNPDDFVAGWYEPGYEDEICANVWMPLPEPPALAPHPKARNE